MAGCTLRAGAVRKAETAATNNRPRVQATKGWATIVRGQRNGVAVSLKDVSGNIKDEAVSESIGVRSKVIAHATYLMKRYNAAKSWIVPHVLGAFAGIRKDCRIRHMQRDTSSYLFYNAPVTGNRSTFPSSEFEPCSRLPDACCLPYRG